jgi:hypothetical protein
MKEWMDNNFIAMGMATSTAGWLTSLNLWFQQNDPMLKGIVLMLTIVATSITIFIGLRKVYLGTKGE